MNLLAELIEGVKNVELANTMQPGTLPLFRPDYKLSTVIKQVAVVHPARALATVRAMGFAAVTTR